MPAPQSLHYALLVLDAPHGRGTGARALAFARAALARGHRVRRVFFYADGAQHGNLLATPPQGEADLVAAWRELALANGIELVVCIAAALRRGVLDDNERHRYGKAAANLDPAFVLSGLGQLAEVALEADRLVTFGGAA